MRISTLAAAPRALSRPVRRRGIYYGWVIVGALGLTETVSYGVLLYAFSVLLEPMRAELGWPQAVLTGGFSLAALTAGILAIPVGRWVDRYGARRVMTLGSVAATLLLLAWSRVDQPAEYYLIWTGIGACMAAVFYEPAFAVVTNWFDRYRSRALTVVTLAGGLASTIFVPLTALLVAKLEWRSTVVCLATILGVLTIIPHAFLLRRRPEDCGLSLDGLVRPLLQVDAVAPGSRRSIPAATAIRTSAFRWLTAAFFLSSAANLAAAVHLVPLLLERGYSLAFAGGAMAALGLSKLPGRLLIAPLAERVSSPTAAAAVFGCQIAALIALLVFPSTAGVWTFVALFGAGDGAATPLRAGILADLFGRAEYGTISGALALFLALARAAGPVGGSFARSVADTYDGLLWAMLATVSLAIGAMALAKRGTMHDEDGIIARGRDLRVPAAASESPKECVLR